VSTALQVSTYSYKALATACLPLMGAGGSIVGLTFDATKAWPVYDWMGVAKAGLESASRYLALHLGKHGIRSNLVSAGPLRTMAAKSIPGFDQFEDAWAARAPLGWDLNDQVPGGPGDLRAAVRLVPGHHRRDHPRGRRLPRLGA
jgi:enoyl-[acyl-carrier protein] reductase I